MRWVQLKVEGLFHSCWWFNIVKAVRMGQQTMYYTKYFIRQRQLILIYANLLAAKWVGSQGWIIHFKNHKMNTWKKYNIINFHLGFVHLIWECNSVWGFEWVLLRVFIFAASPFLLRLHVTGWFGLTDPFGRWAARVCLRRNMARTIML